MCPNDTKDSLFVRLGGIPAVRACVDEFYKRLLRDERLGFFFDDVQLARLKIHQLEFFKLTFSGVPEDVDVPAMMLEKHKRLFAEKGLNETHFDMVAEHFVGTLQHLGVSSVMIEEAVGVIAPLRAVFEEGAEKFGGSVSEEKKQEEIVDWTATTAHKKPGTLLDKLGGNAAVEAAVGELYKRLLADISLAPFFENMNMALLKIHQVKFMKIAFDQIPEDLDVAAFLKGKHSALFAKGLNETHFDRVATHFVATLQHLGIDQTLIDEAVAIIGPLRPAFELGAIEDAKLIKVSIIVCK